MMPGLGEPVFDRLDADIARALMSIPAVKAVEIGDGFSCVEARGRSSVTPSGRTAFRVTMPEAFSEASPMAMSFARASSSSLPHPF